MQNADCSDPHPGKRVAVFSFTRYDGDKDEEKRPYRLVVSLVIRMSDRHGQLFLEAQFDLVGWTTSLVEKGYDDETVIRLYRDHATSEQAHTEFKTDLDLERLPSCKFDTNALVMAFGVAGRMMEHGRRLVLRFGKHCPGFNVYGQLHRLLN